jgi:hypothetical protein
MQSNLLGKATSTGMKFDREENPADGNPADTVREDHQGCTLQAIHENQCRKGKTTGADSEKHTTRGLRVVDTFTTFDKDKKPTDRLTDKYDDKGRLRSRRRDYFNKNGDVVGGTETTYTYDGEGRITEELTSWP